MIRDDCAGCEGCDALEAEAGPVYGRLYAKKLLIRGWAGHKSPAEKLYLASHPPDWYANAVLNVAGHEQNLTSGGKARRTTRELVPA